MSTKYISGLAGASFLAFSAAASATGIESCQTLDDIGVQKMVALEKKLGSTTDTFDISEFMKEFKREASQMDNVMADTECPLPKYVIERQKLGNKVIDKLFGKNSVPSGRSL